jgi:chromate transporter
MAMARDVGSSEGRAGEVLRAFLRLGLMSFGGPVAHLGYFHEEFVERRRWCSGEEYAEIVAIAQSLPGPASSQVGFALGLRRAGWLGGAAAWLAFTGPSAALMLCYAYGHNLLGGRMGSGLVHGLQLAAVAVVAQAVVAMQKTLAPDWRRMLVAAVAAGLVLTTNLTLAAIALGALFGVVMGVPAVAAQPKVEMELRLSRRVGAAAGVIFVLLLVASLLVTYAPPGQAVPGPLVAVHPVQVFGGFYRAGALVFGGGHVVLPLLESAVVAPGWVSQWDFLSGYGAAQALPGPLFTFSAYLGAVIRPSAYPLAFSALALVGIFLPGLLAMVAVLPYWSELRSRRRVQGVLRGVNAAVVGVLFAAFWHPVCSSTLHDWRDVGIALAALLALLRWKLPPWMVVAMVGALSAALGA